MIEAFVDESGRGGRYLLACVLVESGRLRPVRSQLRAMRWAGERRIHLVNESPGRRGALLDRMASLDVTVVAYQARQGGQRTRPQLLDLMVADLAARGAHRLTLESRGDLDRFDRRHLASRRSELPVGLEYQHRRPHEEPLLWLADGAAWAVGAGGAFRRRLAPILAEVRHLP